jgi:hypothetical protein
MLSSVGGARMPHTLPKFCGRILHFPTAGTLQPACCTLIATSCRATGRACSAKAGAEAGHTRTGGAETGGAGAKAKGGAGFPGKGPNLGVWVYGCLWRIYIYINSGQRRV